MSGADGGHALKATRWLAVVLSLAALVPLVTPGGAEAAYEESGYLTMRDGVRLKYSVVRPAEQGRYPTLFLFDGYDAGSNPRSISGRLADEMLAKGYALFGVNVRGSGCSGGRFDFFEPQWATDGYDAIEWAAAQPWSDGHVGMWGFSFGGELQIPVAAKRPPHLDAIAPGEFFAEAYRDVAYPGGIYNRQFVELFNLAQPTINQPSPHDAVVEGDAECLANQAQQPATNAPTRVDVQVPQHPYFDEIYRERNPLTYATAIDIPALTLASWQDEQVGGRVGSFIYDHMDPHKTWIVQSSGQHHLYVQSERFRALIKRFFDWTLKGEPNGFDASPRVQIWHETGGAEHGPAWVTQAATWPPQVETRTLHLGPGGRLEADPPDAEGEPESYDYPRPAPSTAAADADATGDEANARNAWSSSTSAAGGSLAYTTPPFKDDRELYGPASLDLWFASTASDTDIQVTLTEVRPDGEELYVQRGWLRASHRALDESLSTPRRPYQTHAERDAQPLVPGDPTPLRIEVFPFNHVFRKGSSLRLWIEAPSSTGLWGFDSIATEARNSVYHDRSHPSRLVVGLVPHGRAPGDHPPCGAIYRQPCRKNPLPVPEGSDPLRAAASAGSEPASGGVYVSLPKSRPCRTSGSVDAPLHVASPARLAGVRAYADRRRVRVGIRRGNPTTLRVHLPRSRVRARIIAFTNSGQRFVFERSYTACRSGPRIRLSVSPRRMHAGTSKTLRFRAFFSAEGRRRALKGVRIRFAGRAAVTGDTGSARIRVRVRRVGLIRARATKQGFRKGAETVRVLPARR